MSGISTAPSGGWPGAEQDVRLNITLPCPALVEDVVEATHPRASSLEELVIVINDKLESTTGPSSGFLGNGVHTPPPEPSSPVVASPPRRQHSISYSRPPHLAKTRKGSRAGSIGYTAFSPRPSLSRHSSIATNPPLDRTKVKDHLLLAVFACFCPVWPINIVGFVYSIMSRNSLEQGNLDGAVRLGRVAKMLSVVSLALGTVIIIACIVNLAINVKT